MTQKYLKFILLITILMLSCRHVFSEEVSSLGDGRYESDEVTLTTPFNGNGKVLINSAMGLSGNLHVKAIDGNEAKFRFRKLIKSDSRSEAMDFAEMVEITLEKIPDGLRLFLQAPNPVPWGGTDYSVRIEGELELPQNCQLDIDAIYYDMNIIGPFGSVKNKSSFGKLQIEQVIGIIDLTTSSREIIARDIGGTVSLATNNANIKISNLNSDKSAEIRNEYGSISIENVKGTFNITNSFGKIKLDNILITGRPARIAANYTPIRIDLTGVDNSSLSVNNANDDVEIRLSDTISTKISLAVGSGGEINVEGLNMKPTLVKSNHLEFTCGKGESNLTVDIEGDGSIYLKGIPSK
jgi:hypothetical protein